MSQRPLEKLKKELETLTNEAFADSPDISKLLEVKDKLGEIPVAEQSFFREFSDDFANRCFLAGIGLPGVSLDDFGTPARSSTTLGAVERVEQRDVNEVITHFVKVLENDLPTLKNYFLVTCNRDQSSNLSPIVIHDDNYFIDPIKDRLTSSDLDDVRVLSIARFVKELHRNATDESHLCLLLLTSKMNSPDAIEESKNRLSYIHDQFDSLDVISLRNLDFESDFFVKKTLLKSEFLETVGYLTSTFLTNTKLAHEEEKIIKKLFKDHRCPLIEYRILKEGFSGAKVVEILPKKRHNNDAARRFIVKYQPRTDENKLQIETQNFKEWIGDYRGTSQYQCEYTSTTTHEGILYNYAISDNEAESFSFSRILDESDNRFRSDVSGIINKLFENSIFEKWEETKVFSTASIGELYGDFLKTEKIFDQVRKILSISDRELQEHTIHKNLNKILEYPVECPRKVCHGDLHTDNFFVDEGGVFLIDFGFTRKLHCLIDHVALECSIKFRHIPNYIDQGSLRTFEKELVSEQTFESSYKIGHSQRPDLKFYAELIRAIRLNATRYLSTANNLEYFVALFIMTFRQIKYTDTNQLYALNSAEILCDKIVRTI